MERSHGVHFQQAVVGLELARYLNAVAGPQLAKPGQLGGLSIEGQARVGILHVADITHLGSIEHHGPNRNRAAGAQGPGRFHGEYRRYGWRGGKSSLGSWGKTNRQAGNEE